MITGFIIVLACTVHAIVAMFVKMHIDVIDIGAIVMAIPPLLLSWLFCIIDAVLLEMMIIPSSPSFISHGCYHHG